MKFFVVNSRLSYVLHQYSFDLDHVKIDSDSIHETNYKPPVSVTIETALCRLTPIYYMTQYCTFT